MRGRFASNDIQAAFYHNCPKVVPQDTGTIFTTQENRPAVRTRILRKEKAVLSGIKDLRTGWRPWDKGNSKLTVFNARLRVNLSFLQKEETTTRVLNDNSPCYKGEKKPSTRFPNLLRKVANQLVLRFDEEGWATVRKPSAQKHGLLTQLSAHIQA